MRHRTRGRLTCPMVLRSPCGARHSRAGASFRESRSDVRHMPGLRVVIPSSPARAYGLLLAAIRDPGSRSCFWSRRGFIACFAQEVADDGEALAARRLLSCSRVGRDATIVTWGAAHVEEAARGRTPRRGRHLSRSHRRRDLEAARLRNDPRAPWRRPGAASSCMRRRAPPALAPKSRREIGERALYSLRAPIQRVTGYDVVVPLSRLEQQYMPERRTHRRRGAQMSWRRR